MASRVQQFAAERPSVPLPQGAAFTASHFHHHPHRLMSDDLPAKKQSSISSPVVSNSLHDHSTHKTRSTYPLSNAEHHERVVTSGAGEEQEGIGGPGEDDSRNLDLDQDGASSSRGSSVEEHDPGTNSATTRVVPTGPPDLQHLPRSSAAASEYEGVAPTRDTTGSGEELGAHPDYGPEPEAHAQPPAIVPPTEQNLYPPRRVTGGSRNTDTIGENDRSETWGAAGPEYLLPRYEDEMDHRYHADYHDPTAEPVVVGVRPLRLPTRWNNHRPRHQRNSGSSGGTSNNSSYYDHQRFEARGGSFHQQRATRGGNQGSRGQYQREYYYYVDSGTGSGGSSTAPPRGAGGARNNYRVRERGQHLPHSNRDSGQSFDSTGYPNHPRVRNSMPPPSGNNYSPGSGGPRAYQHDIDFRRHSEPFLQGSPPPDDHLGMQGSNSYDYNASRAGAGTGASGRDELDEEAVEREEAAIEYIRQGIQRHLDHQDQLRRNNNLQEQERMRAELEELRLERDRLEQDMNNLHLDSQETKQAMARDLAEAHYNIHTVERELFQEREKHHLAASLVERMREQLQEKQDKLQDKEARLRDLKKQHHIAQREKLQNDMEQRRIVPRLESNRLREKAKILESYMRRRSFTIDA
ncbi:unnamed protein product [Amoebophrya sp. A120]|nr:unnamed protein product [Amoebophrya sp. A120]|eukprot:GSA120T00018539001.1